MMNNLILMQELMVQSLRFCVRAESTVIFSGEPGAALRGALYEALALNFCSETFGTAALDPNHKQHCPVCCCPYIARAVQKMGDIGIGRIRAQFTLLGILEVQPLLDMEREMLNNNTVSPPTLQINAAVVRDVAMSLPTAMVTIEFLTPMRLIADKQLLNKITLEFFVHRLIERCQSLVELYAESPEGISLASRQAWASDIYGRPSKSGANVLSFNH